MSFKNFTSIKYATKREQHSILCCYVHRIDSAIDTKAGCKMAWKADEKVLATMKLSAANASL
jgi:hypothetical protein